MNKDTLKHFFTTKNLDQKIAFFSQSLGHEVDFDFMDKIRKDDQFLDLWNTARMTYLFCITIRPSIDKNKTTHTTEIFGQMVDNLVQIAQQCGDFVKEIAYYDPDCTVLRIKNQLDYVKELKMIDENQKVKYDDAVDHLFLVRHNFQTYHDLDTMLYNILACLCEIKGLMSSNMNQVNDFINYDEGQNHGY